MRAILTAVTLLAGAAVLPAEEAVGEGTVYVPKDGKSFKVTDKDTVRLTGPGGGTGYTTTVKVTQGEATVKGRSVVAVVMGKTAVGGGQEYDLTPKAGQKGTVKVTMTMTPPGAGGTPEVKEFEFEVK